MDTFITPETLRTFFYLTVVKATGTNFAPFDLIYCFLTSIRFFHLKYMIKVVNNERRKRDRIEAEPIENHKQENILKDLS